MSSPHNPAPVVIDQGVEAIRLTTRPEWKTDPALRDEAILRSNLAIAQQTKAQNIIAYLNSDRTSWNVDDENLVRAYLTLAPVPADSDGTETYALVAAPPAPVQERRAPVTPLPQRDEHQF